VLAHLVVDLLVAQVERDAQALGFELGCHLAAVVGLVVGDVEHRHLHRRQPGRQGAGVLLDQDADEAL